MDSLRECCARLFCRFRYVFIAFATAWLGLFMALTALAEARPAELVKNIFPGGSANPRNFTIISDTLFFVAENAEYGAELWKSDGTQAGTMLVRDIAPIDGETLVPGELSAFDGLLYFRGNSGSGEGEELWISDGTVSGTLMLKDLYPAGSSFPYRFRPVADTLFFVATDDHGEELWKTDGTITGTVMVTDIHPTASSSPSILTAVGNTLFFVASDGEHGDELWKSDGTAAGTVMVRDIYDGPTGSLPRNLVNLNGTLLFTALTETDGRELWRSDGTVAGTVMVKEIVPDQNTTLPDKLTVVGNYVYFTADDGVSGIELWRSNGTDAGTTRVRDIYSGSNGSQPNHLTAVGSLLYFSAADGVHGRELWRSNGTSAGTSLVKDVHPGAAGSGLRDFSAVGNTLYFSADDGASGHELWRSEGNAANTLLLSDIHPGAGSDPRSIIALGPYVLFNADDGASGRELWRVNPENVGPSADAGGPYSGLEGETIGLSATADDADGDTLQIGWTVDSPDCMFDDATQLQTSLTCADDGSFEVTVTVTDPFGVTAVSSAPVTVDNVAPEFISLDASASVGANVVLNLSFIDAGAGDTHSYEVDWGNGDVTVGNLPVGEREFVTSYVYRSGGDYEVTVTVSDDDGASDVATYAVSIQFVIHLPAVFKP